MMSKIYNRSGKGAVQILATSSVFKSHLHQSPTLKEKEKAPKNLFSL